uniref:Uncharacterized protein n=1 Tax=Oryza nivara TaxID=4536 RepID=A0A0E0HM04_ORYNI
MGRRGLSLRSSLGGRGQRRDLSGGTPAVGAISGTDEAGRSRSGPFAAKSGKGGTGSATSGSRRRPWWIWGGESNLLRLEWDEIDSTAETAAKSAATLQVKTESSWTGNGDVFVAMAFLKALSRTSPFLSFAIFSLFGRWQALVVIIRLGYGGNKDWGRREILFELAKSLFCLLRPGKSPSSVEKIEQRESPFSEA